MIEIRKEQPEDCKAVRTIIDMAFDQPGAGKVVDRIRSTCEEHLSLVAVRKDKVVGQIFFSPVSARSEKREMIGMRLAPIAVKPEYQGQGIKLGDKTA